MIDFITDFSVWIILAFAWSWLSNKTDVLMVAIFSLSVMVVFSVFYVWYFICGDNNITSW